MPQKIGGWASISFDYSAQISGTCRRIFSAYLSYQSNMVTVLGTNTNLYALTGTRLTNITPLNTATTVVANSLTSDYRTLAANPVTTVNGSGIITISDASASQYQAGDTLNLAGFATTNGISSTLINGQQLLQSVGATSYTIATAGAASSSGTGGGSSCVVSSGLITVAATAHGQTNGQRTKITGAATFAGISSTLINVEFIVRGAAMNSFQIMTTGFATSSVSAGGGSATAYQTQLAAGSQNENAAAGYGAGYYGVGLYGTGLTSANGRTTPRIWYIDRFQATMMLTPGNQGGLYTWNGNTATAPSLLANAPTAINYAFVSNDIVVTFGYQGVGNQIFASDIQNPTNWTAASSNQVFQDTVSGAGQLISALPVSGTNLIFSNNRTYVFTYIGLPLVWSIALLDARIGIIAPLACCTVNGVAYWMGQNNFYRWRGMNVEIIPANSQLVSTILNYVFTNLTSSQRSKIFAWYNERFGEIWFHYPSAQSNEPDRVARVNVNENFIWSPDTFQRTAAESPDILGLTPRLIDWNSILYNHETGTDANGVAMPFSLVGNLNNYGAFSFLVSSIVPDSIQTGNISLTITSYEYPQSPVPTNETTVTITPTTTIVQPNTGGRYWQYEWSGNQLGQSWIMGKWQAYLQETGAKA